MKLALTPQITPGRLDRAFRAELPEGDFPDAGGQRDEATRSLMAAGETAAFLLAGKDLEASFAVQALFSPDSVLSVEGLVRFEPARLATGRQETLAFGPGFPAHRLTSPRTWDDLVLPPDPRLRLS